MKWISSLDELLYEVMSWLIFFPLTLWRTLVHPFRMMEYAEQQLTLPAEEQYGTALSPPLFLALTLMLAHGVAAALGEQDAIVASKHGLAGLINDNTSALVLRMVAFASFPVFAATRLVRRRGVALNRLSLRRPFYAQCYPVAVAALAVSIGTSLASASLLSVRPVAAPLIRASILYFVVVETLWFAQKLSIGLVRAAADTAVVLVEGIASLFLLGFLFRA